MRKTIHELRAHSLIRKAWRKVALRNLTASDNHSQLDRLYAVPDPWNMTSLREQYRFEATNALLGSKVGQVGTLLELGCGEGHQSEHLQSLCDRLYGLDVSPRAVKRARERMSQGEFEVGALPHVPWTPAGGKFDLVVACEVLYYMRDIPGTLQRMSELGNTCFVTFFSASARVVACHLDGLPELDRGWFCHGSVSWLWALWRPGQR